MLIEKFNKETEAWLRRQDISIESCEMNIRHYQQNVSMLQRLIAAEQGERKAKIEMKADVLENLKKVNNKEKQDQHRPFVKIDWLENLWKENNK